MLLLSCFLKLFQLQVSLHFIQIQFISGFHIWRGSKGDLHKETKRAGKTIKSTFGKRCCCIKRLYDIANQRNLSLM